MGSHSTACKAHAADPAQLPLRLLLPAPQPSPPTTVPAPRSAPCALARFLVQAHRELPPSSGCQCSLPAAPARIPFPAAPSPSWPCCRPAVSSEGTPSADQPPPSLGISICNLLTFLHCMYHSLKIISCTSESTRLFSASLTSASLQVEVLCELGLGVSCFTAGSLMPRTSCSICVVF